jgi:RND family efflux transporter MFP subunit
MNETGSTEARLREEVEQLKQQLAAQKKLHESGAHARTGPSATTLVLIALTIVGLIVVGFVTGYLPRQKREQVLAAESKDNARSLPTINFARVERSATKTQLVLPGNVQAMTEAPVLARASGYIRKRYKDIGDRVHGGDVMAEIEAPELDQQILQANAALDQSKSSVQQAEAAVEQGKANENLAKVTAGRWDNLQKRGVVSKQENDTYQAQWAAQQANVQALGKALAAAQSNVGAVQANLERLKQLKTYQTVRAPFDGVVTVRNVDTGALVNEANTLLYRVAQTGSLRVYVNLPQSESENVRPGQHATLTIAELPGKKFDGTVTRTSNALDPTSRTLLTELQVANTAGLLLPGMYAQVDLSVPRRDPPLLIPGDTLVVRSDGPQVAVIGEGDTVHFTRVQLGRDFGDRLEVLSGMEEGQRLAVNPSDAVSEGAKVNPKSAEKAGKKQ